MPETSNSTEPRTVDLKLRSSQANSRWVGDTVWICCTELTLHPRQKGEGGCEILSHHSKWWQLTNCVVLKFSILYFWATFGHRSLKLWKMKPQIKGNYSAYNVAMSIHAHVFVWTCIYISVGWIPRNGALSDVVPACLIEKNFSKLISCENF